MVHLRSEVSVLVFIRTSEGRHKREDFSALDIKIIHIHTLLQFMIIIEYILDVFYFYFCFYRGVFPI